MTDGVDPRWTKSPRSLLVPVVMAVMGAVLAAANQATVGEVTFAVFAAFGVSFLGWRLLVPILETPIFRARWRWALALTFTLGGPLGAAAVHHGHEIGVEQSAAVAVAVGAILFLAIGLLFSSHRGRGRWVGRMASRNSGPPCPSCGMGRDPQSEKCGWCGARRSGGRPK